MGASRIERKPHLDNTVHSVQPQPTFQYLSSTFTYTRHGLRTRAGSTLSSPRTSACHSVTPSQQRFRKIGNPHLLGCVSCVLALTTLDYPAHPKKFMPPTAESLPMLPQRQGKTPSSRKFADECLHPTHQTRPSCYHNNTCFQTLCTDNWPRTDL